MNTRSQDDLHDPSRRGFLATMNVVLKIVIALVVCVLGMLTLIPEIQRHREAKAEIERLKRELSNYEAQLAEKKRELRLLQSDPGYVELIARDRLDLMKEGETVFRMEPPQGSR